MSDKDEHEKTIGITIGMMAVIGLVCLAMGEYVIILLLLLAGTILLKRARSLGVEPRDPNEALSTRRL